MWVFYLVWVFSNVIIVGVVVVSNRITRDGAKELAKLLKYNTPLKVLDLGFNRLGDDGARHLAEALATYNTNLTKLYESMVIRCSYMLYDICI